MSIETMREMCLKKKRYFTIEMAEHVQKKVKKERGTSLRIYSCPICCSFHLTNDLRMKGD